MKITSLVPCPLPIPAIHTATSLPADVVFGSPKRRCAGSGICRMLAWSALPAPRIACAYYPVRLRATAPDQLVLTLAIADLPGEHLERWFGKKSFHNETIFRLPLALTRPLFGHRVTIPAGHYPFSIKDGTISIWFTVSVSGKPRSGRA